MGLSAGPVPPRVDAHVKAGLLDLVDHAAAVGGWAVVSASRNAAAVLEAADVADLFDIRVDGADAADLGLPGKPDPALFLEAARRWGLSRRGRRSSKTPQPV